MPLLHSMLFPFPIAYLGHVLPVLVNVLPVLDQFVLGLPLQTSVMVLPPERFAVTGE